MIHVELDSQYLLIYFIILVIFVGFYIYLELRIK